MLTTLVGTRLPAKYHKFFKLPERLESWKRSDTADTLLERAAARWLRQNDAACGVYRLNFGQDALGVRLGLIDRAEHTIDIQSYLIRDDISGNLVGLHLAEAADRGVRVRLLMDDALTHEIDAGLLSLDVHHNIEVRVFNPFPRRRSRLISFIANFNILNRRMHNKSFTVDNQVTIVGGRNLADEYFQSGGKAEFIDEDLLAIGVVVDDVSDGFDKYWNSQEAIPINAFNAMVPHSSLEDSTQQGRKYLEEHEDGEFLKSVDDALAAQLADATLPLVAAEASVVIDEPDKIRRLLPRPSSITSTFLQQMVAGAKTELIIISPYFVPQKQGVDFFGSLVERGVRVVIISNSLATTNHSSVHAVYARYRKPLLACGVELYELRPQVESLGMTTKLTLHSKVATIDRNAVFVGSFNLDPRSLYLNTEMGMAVNSDELAGSMALSILESLPDIAYKLQLSEKRRLQWLLQASNVEEVITTEPRTTWWRRFKTRLMSFLPIEGQM
ncbi:MAG: phospholipase D family protein [Gammaproteobacteria bacterium]|nr:phospholipase D family protein [Gammaproteobacteria bacterium]NNL49440.1 phospholipase D family protein [Woeseiaceae bacterium]